MPTQSYICGIRAAGIGFVLLVLTMALSLAAPAQVSGGFRIAGTVVSATSGHPLEKARITITNTKTRKNAFVITPEDGRFDFSQLPAGKYSLEGAKKGFIHAAYDEHEQFSTAIVTGAGLDTENLVLRLPPSAMLSGRVLDESGEPVRHAQINIFREDHGTAGSQIRRVGVEETDDQGSFEAAALDGGTYFLSATAAPWYAIHPMTARRESAENLPTSVDRSLDVAYPTTYYADATEVDEASPIPVRGGDHIKVDIHLNPVPSLHLLLRAPDAANGAMAMPQLGKRGFDGMDYVPIGEMQPISPGLFEITGVPAGRYVVGSPGSAPDQAADAPEVDFNSNGQELAAAGNDSGTSIKASVQLMRGSNLPDHLGIVLRKDNRRVQAFQEVNSNGEVEFPNLPPGLYAITVFTPEKAYAVARITSQGNNITGNKINLAAGSPLSLSLWLVSGEATVEGFARRQGKPMSGVMIVLVPKDPELHRDRFRRDQSDLDGSFSLPNVIPGSYTVVAIENGWDLDWSEPGAISHYSQHGLPLTVDDQSQGTVRVATAVEVQPR